MRIVWPPFQRSSHSDINHGGGGAGWRPGLLIMAFRQIAVMNMAMSHHNSTDQVIMNGATWRGILRDIAPLASGKDIHEAVHDLTELTVRLLPPGLAGGISGFNLSPAVRQVVGVAQAATVVSETEFICCSGHLAGGASNGESHRIRPGKPSHPADSWNSICSRTDMGCGKRQIPRTARGGSVPSRIPNQQLTFRHHLRPQKGDRTVERAQGGRRQKPRFQGFAGEF